MKVCYVCFQIVFLSHNLTSFILHIRMHTHTHANTHTHTPHTHTCARNCFLCSGVSLAILLHPSLSSLTDSFIHPISNTRINLVIYIINVLWHELSYDHTWQGLNDACKLSAFYRKSMCTVTHTKF